ncbi:MAG: hypothetical protein P1V35_16550 [Planctomycetota bacterium]|nr:hypothetical protein [Planctomycetota bacterium]
MSDSVTKLVKCERCAAQASRHDARFCEYCGAELPKAAGARSPAQGAGGRALNLEERFRALREHSDWARLQSFSPEDAGKASPLAVGMGGLFLVMWIGIGGTVTMGFAATGFGPIVLFPLAILFFGLFAMLRGAREYQTFRNAPIIPCAALVVDERVQVSGGGKNSRATTKYFTTLEMENGKRSEFNTIESAAIQACPGDVGVAYLRNKTLVYFERVPV